MTSMTVVTSPYFTQYQKHRPPSCQVDSSRNDEKDKECKHDVADTRTMVPVTKPTPESQEQSVPGSPLSLLSSFPPTLSSSALVVIPPNYTESKVHADWWTSEEESKLAVYPLVRSMEEFIEPDYDYAGMKTISMDVGGDVFVTLYDPTRGALEIGDHEQSAHILRLRAKALTLWRTATPSSQAAARRLEQEIDARVDQAHERAVALLLTYDVVVIPPGVPTTPGSCSEWRLKDFKERVHSCIAESKDKITLVECAEHQTSLTCGRCGILHRKLGSNRKFTCPECGYSAPRDANAARNLYLKYKAGCLTQRRKRAKPTRVLTTNVQR